MDIEKIINACTATYTREDDFLSDDDFQEDLLFGEEPTDDEIMKMEGNNLSTPKKTRTPLTFGVPTTKRRDINPVNPIFWAVRKEVYAFNNEAKSPLIAGDSPSIVCRHCGKTHYVSDLILKGEEQKHSDAIFALLNLYDFAYKCECNKYIYGYFVQPDTSEFEKMLEECVNELKVKGKKTRKTSPKTPKIKETKFGEQLSFFDVCEGTITISSEETSNPTEISELTVSVENVPPTIEEKMACVAKLNKDLDDICDKVYKNEEYSETIASFENLKMKDLINEAKSRDGIKNFMRMLKKEIISCIIFYDNQMPELNDLLDMVQDRTSWLYGKYKDLK